MGDHIFICYARKDQDFVLSLAARLNSRGAPVWLDQWDIAAGTNWNQRIDSALRDCGKFLIVLSPAAVSSTQVQGELQMALDENKLIVPVLYQACQVPRMLRLIQHIDFTGCRPDDVATLNQLAHALRLPKPGPLPPRERPVTSNSRCLWRYGTVGGSLLVLGLLIAWLWLYQATDIIPPPQSSSLPKPSLSVPEDKPEDIPKVSVYVDTQPPGVSIYQDGHHMATTPWQFDAPVGSHVRAVLKGEGLEDREINFWVNSYKNVYSYRMDKRSGR